MVSVAQLNCTLHCKHVNAALEVEHKTVLLQFRCSFEVCSTLSARISVDVRLVWMSTAADSCTVVIVFRCLRRNWIPI